MVSKKGYPYPLDKDGNPREGATGREAEAAHQ
jgi:hypothetical protein